MCRGPLPYGQAGATRIFSDSAGSFAARRRAKDHTNECEQQRERRGRPAGETERNAAPPLVNDDGGGGVEVMPRNGRVRDGVVRRTRLRARRGLAVTDDLLVAGGGKRRADGPGGEAARRRHGAPDRSGREDRRATLTGGRRLRKDQRRFGG